AFPGWHTDGRRFTFNRTQHDDGTKTVLGRSGNWDGGDVVRIVLGQPAAARFLVGKLYRYIISEGAAPPDRLLDPLAERFRASGYDVADLVGTVLRSRLFFSGHAYRQRVKSPVEYVVGTLRALEAKYEPPVEYYGSQTQTRLLDGLGQELFAPPSVKGWAGGEAWLNSATLLARHNLAWKVVQATPGTLGVASSPPALLRRYALRRDPEGQIDFLLELLLQPAAGEVADGARRRLVEFLGQGPPPSASARRRPPSC